MPIGKGKIFNEERGFGFIKPDDGSAEFSFISQRSARARTLRLASGLP